MSEGRAFLSHKGWDNLENYWYSDNEVLPDYQLREIAADVRVDRGIPWSDVLSTGRKKKFGTAIVLSDIRKKF
jgi:hypothetical protein